MNKQEYIIKQISKTNKKNFENYVVTRIWHGLNRLDVKFKTQQLVIRKSGYSLTDLFFPQLELHIEIDEPFHKKQKIEDVKREAEIIQATNHKILRIKITDDLTKLNKQIDQIINYLIEMISEKEIEGNFIKWDPLREFDPKLHNERGYLDVADNPKFLKIVDACNCLGQKYKDIQGGWFKSKIYPNHHLWFPKFYDNADWDNKISDDGNFIYERCKKEEMASKWFANKIEDTKLRICFPKTIDNLGRRFYRFVGVFQTDFELSSEKSGAVHRRVSKRFIINNCM